MHPKGHMGLEYICSTNIMQGKENSREKLALVLLCQAQMSLQN